MVSTLKWLGAIVPVNCPQWTTGRHLDQNSQKELSHPNNRADWHPKDSISVEKHWCFSAPAHVQIPSTYLIIFTSHLPSLPSNSSSTWFLGVLQKTKKHPWTNSAREAEGLTLSSTFMVSLSSAIHGKIHTSHVKDHFHLLGTQTKLSPSASMNYAACCWLLLCLYCISSESLLNGILHLLLEKWLLFPWFFCPLPPTNMLPVSRDSIHQSEWMGRSDFQASPSFSRLLGLPHPIWASPKLK